MNSTRMAILATAAVAGAASVGVVLHSMASAHRPAPAIIAAPVDPHPTVRVLVAKHDLNVGDRIADADMAWQAWPADNLNPGFITDGAPNPGAVPTGQFARKVDQAADAVKGALSDPSKGAGAAVLGSLVHERILANEPIVRDKLVRAGAGGVMAVTLTSGMRAVALPLTAENAAGGFILPGDHVDVLLTRSTDTQSSSPGTGSSLTAGHVTSTVMRNVKVLAIDQNAGATKASAVIGATATVECSPTQAEYLVLAKASGTLTLMLRSFVDAQGPAQSGQSNASGEQVVRVFRNGAATPIAVTR